MQNGRLRYANYIRDYNYMIGVVERAVPIYGLPSRMCHEERTNDSDNNLTEQCKTRQNSRKLSDYGQKGEV